MVHAGVKADAGIDMSLLLYNCCSLQECVNSEVTIVATSVIPVPMQRVRNNWLDRTADSRGGNARVKGKDPDDERPKTIWLIVPCSSMYK